MKFQTFIDRLWFALSGGWSAAVVVAAGGGDTWAAVVGAGLAVASWKLGAWKPRGWNSEE